MLVSVHLTCEHASYGHRPSNSLNYHVNYYITTCTITPFAFNWTGFRMVMLPVSPTIPARSLRILPLRCLLLSPLREFHGGDFRRLLYFMCDVNRLLLWTFYRSRVVDNLLSSVQPFLPVESFPWGELANSLQRFDKSHFSAKARNLDAN